MDYLLSLLRPRGQRRCGRRSAIKPRSSDARTG
jgi:hypothetical protein